MSLKLGSDTASVTNWLLSGTVGAPTPAVGMGATILMWTDSHAATITRVSPSGKSFWMVQDVATRTDKNGMSECQDYAFTPGTGPEIMVRQTKRGWKCNRGGVRVGDRREYHDYSF